MDNRLLRQPIAEVFEDSEFRVISGSTDTHLFLLDVSAYEINGNQLQKLLDDVGITVNKNGISFDQLPPSKSSGIRIGTPAITTRGLMDNDAREVARLIIKVAENQKNTEVLSSIKEDIQEITNRIPLYKK